jgi:hypothetical protein
MGAWWRDENALTRELDPNIRPDLIGVGSRPIRAVSAGNTWRAAHDGP